MEDPEMFMRKVEVSPSGCWLWRGQRDRRGYGRCVRAKRARFAHRHSYEIFLGPIPDDTYICHKCDNPPCVNPAHLFAGTQRDNMSDCKRKGRHIHGERQHLAKLRDGDVRVIYEAYVAGESQEALAKRFSISRATVQQIVQGTSWKHLHLAPIDGSYRMGFGAPKGETHGASKLTDETVLLIRARRATGEKLRVIAAEYGISESLVYQVFSRRIWKHI